MEAVRTRDIRFSSSRNAPPCGSEPTGDGPDFDFISLFFELREVVRHLHTEPNLRARPKRFG